HAGRPVLYLGPNGRHLVSFPEHLAEVRIAEAAFTALHALPRQTRRRTLVIEKIDGRAVRESPWHELMLRCGFVADYRGLAAEAFA
ncbi:MAG: hypothetical protein KDI82_17770, partial [Gammaproteobacteria bacterium]|nr:hypothetical protein [Gammaproteobacteria bacterium]